MILQGIDERVANAVVRRPPAGLVSGDAGETRIYTSAYPKMLGAWAERSHARDRMPMSILASAPPGHPARGRQDVAAGLLACGSSSLSGLPSANATPVTARRQ